jgi:prefoldin subunit 5
MSGADQTQLTMIVLSYHNLYRQHRKLERNLEAIAKSRASMQKVLDELETQGGKDEI